MKINDVYTAYISWPGGGKRRPVLILDVNQHQALVFKITTKYYSKSVVIQHKYYQIQDLKSAGLKKESYIDTISKLWLQKRNVEFHYIGKLSTKDIFGLADFIKLNQ